MHDVDSIAMEVTGHRVSRHEDSLVQMIHAEQ